MQMVEQRPQQAKILEALKRLLCYHRCRHTEAHRYLLPQGKDPKETSRQCTRTSYDPPAKFVPNTIAPEVSFVQHYYRKMVETAGSLIEQLLPKSIHAVTSQGFELKVALFVIAYSLNCYLNL
jgi:hypothetical protein